MAVPGRRFCCESPSDGSGARAPAARSALLKTRDWLLERQHADGHWCAELEGDTILESEYLLLLAYFGRENSLLAGGCAQYLLEKQSPDGGWAMYPGGPIDVSASVKAYFALKLCGHDSNEDALRRARKVILSLGGADAVNSFTRFYLALLGQIPYDLCPGVPPEFVLLPRWFPVNLASVSAWSRTIIVPLSIVSALQPVRGIDPQRGIAELCRQRPPHWPPLRRPGAGPEARVGWARFFRALDSGLRFCQRRGLLPFRRRALEAARQWVLARFDGSDGLGAIFPPIIWGAIALHASGYPEQGPQIQSCLRELERLMIGDPRTGSIRLQPCRSPVWDTAIVIRALKAAGVSAAKRSLRRAAGWLLDVQIRCPGDWSESIAVEPGGWCFEYRNDFYPDVDDTAMVLMALADAFSPHGRSASPKAPPRDVSAQISRGLQWMLAMQNRDGGWGAFDRDNDRQFLCHVPFADHNAMIDPSTPDLAGRVLECLGHYGYRVGNPQVDRAVQYLRRSQEADGAWYGRWGVNYVYGTWQSVAGLAAVGLLPDDPTISAGADWLIRHQQPEGGWGESADSYLDPTRRGQGPLTASQTAWAILGLLSAGRVQHPAVDRGIRFLVDTQQDDGTWREPEFTGTGFPSVFYLRYHYYPIYFPLLAIGRWLETLGGPIALASAGRRNRRNHSLSAPALGRGTEPLAGDTAERTAVMRTKARRRSGR